MKLPALRFRSLQARIIVLFLLLLLTVQVASYTFIRSTISTNARRHAQAEVTVGERVSKRLLAQNGQRLVQAAQAMANDFTLREALATRDQPSITSVLRRHTSRVGADLVMLMGNDGRLLGEASVARGAQARDAIARHIAQAARGGESSPSIGMIGERAYQFVAVPVRPGSPMGWVIIGVLLDERIVKDVAALTSLDVSVTTREAGHAWRLLASTLPTSGHEALLTTLPFDTSEGTGALLVGKDDEFESLIFSLNSHENITVAAVLQRSLAQATAPFKGLQAMLLALTAIGLVLSAIGSIVIARRTTGPLSALVDAARKIEEGDYQHRVAVVMDDEIGKLASAFNHMCHGIAAREHRISELAYADALTGLPNRTLFNDRMVQAVSAAQRSHGALAVLTLDLDRFKHVNDTLGHHMGDLLLREVAFRLQGALQRKTDTVARLGGDEFAVLMPTEGVDGAKLMAHKINEVLSEPLTIDGHLVDVGASIGVAVYPEHGDDANTLMRRADVAMYSAKRASSGFEIYDPRHDENTPARLSLLGELRHAVEHGHLTLVYQPKIDLTGTGGNAAEALVRWNHPERGLIPPDKFIPFAEQTGYIKVVTRKILDEAFRQLTEWRTRGIVLRVSVNISAHDLHSPDFPRYVAELAKVHMAEPDWICLELTESAVMDDPVHAFQVLERLRAMGIRLSIDDFGTGYSSLAYLKRLPVNELKIDKSFVMGLTRDRDDAAIVRATIDLAHHMGLVVTAEGVEHASVLKALCHLGCDMAQGYYISRPLPADELGRWIGQATTPRGDARTIALH